MSENENLRALRGGGADGVSVAQVMATDILSCTPDTPIAEAAARMDASGHASILVRSGERVVGIWTDQDALAQCVSGVEAAATPIAHVMGTPVPSIHARTTLGEATMRFKQDGAARYLVVDDDDRPCGYVVRRDLLLNHGVEWFMRLHTVRDALNGAAPVAGPGMPALEAMQSMHLNGWGAMVVRAPDGTTGVLTSRDLLHKLDHIDADVPAYRVARSRLPTIGLDESLVRARTLLRDNGTHHVGAIDARGELVGLVGSREIIATLDRAYLDDLERALEQRDDALRTSVERYRSLVERSPDAIAVHHEQRIVYINPAGARLLGAYSPGDVMGRLLTDFLLEVHDLPPRERADFLERETGSSPREERLLRLDQREIDVEMATLSVTYGDQPAWQVVMRDVTRRKELERELRMAAVTDRQTGIYNRQYLFEHVEQAIREVDRYDGDLCLVMFDLDRFKQINDQLGHDGGDEVLGRVVECVRSKLRDTDVFARWGGEEFMILAPWIERGGAERLADKLRATIRTIEVNGGEQVTASFGVGIYRKGEQWRRLLKRLDNALYEAKAAGRDCIRFAD